MKTKNKQGTEKRSVSAPSELFGEADKLASSRRMTNFSEYVRDLIRKDLEGKLKPEAKAVAA